MRDAPISILEQFSELEDPRIDRTKRHKLTDVIAVAVCVVICGANGWIDVELFGESKREWLKSFLELPNGIPSHDTPAFAGAGYSCGCLQCWMRRSSSVAL